MKGNDNTNNSTEPPSKVIKVYSEWPMTEFCLFNEAVELFAIGGELIFFMYKTKFYSKMV